LPPRRAEFIEPVECALVSNLPEGPQWTYEAKLDGYRAIGVRDRETILYSRNHKNFNKRFPQIAHALDDLPAETVIDGEVVAPDESGEAGFPPPPALHSRGFANSLLCNSLCNNGKVVRQDSGRRSVTNALRSHLSDVPAEFSAQW
jgi:hypothetical protein